MAGPDRHHYVTMWMADPGGLRQSVRVFGLSLFHCGKRCEHLHSARLQRRGGPRAAINARINMHWRLDRPRACLPLNSLASSNKFGLTAFLVGLPSSREWFQGPGRPARPRQMRHQPP